MGRATADARVKIIDAFNRLVLESRRARPPIAQVLARAGVARSTLYQHFSDRDSLLLEAMTAPLSIMAEAAMGHAREQELAGLLEHFWEQRRSAQEVLEGPFLKRLTRSLADLILARAATLEHGDALRIADSLLGAVRLWVSGETPAPALELAGKMIASATAQRAACAQARHHVQD